VVGHGLALVAVVGLMACAAGLRGGGHTPACALRVAEREGGFVLTAVTGPAGGLWTLRAVAWDGSVTVVQSGTAAPQSGASETRLPGRAAFYDLSLTVLRGGRVVVCPVSAE
jgi:hypothetical protein